jgi:alkylation response protein AidB-like acyl-CoA dehydrogenase
MTSVRMDPMVAAERFAAAVREFGSGGIEEARRLPEPLARKAIELGLMRMCAPVELGGLEVDPATMVRMLETVAVEDGSAAWVVMIAATTSTLASIYPLEAARTAFGPDDVWCGVAAPLGRAVREGDGYRVSGRWPFGSGSEVATWMAGGCVVMDGDTPVAGPGGAAEVRLCLVPSSEVTIHDTWRVNGLRGTGSHDWEVRDAYVPAARTNAIGVDRPWCERPAFTFPIWGLLSLGIAAVALGIGRAAIDELVKLAGEKTPIGANRRLAERGQVQEAAARAEAQLRGARAFLFEAIEDAWTTATSGGRPNLRQRATIRLAATNTAHSAAEVVDAMYTAGGATANYESSPLQRHFRDIHALTQHVMVQPTTWEMTGRILLGLPANTPLI